MPARAILLMTLVAALALCVAELSTIASVDVAGDSCEVINDSSPELADRCNLSGFERHGGALILLALLAAAAAAFAYRGAGRAAAGALVAIGRDFDGATGQAGLGFFLELTGGVLCLLAGTMGLMTGARAASPPAPSASRRSA